MYRYNVNDLIQVKVCECFAYLRMCSNPPCSRLLTVKLVLAPTLQLHGRVNEIFVRLTTNFTPLSMHNIIGIPLDIPEESGILGINYLLLHSLVHITIINIRFL